MSSKSVYPSVFSMSKSIEPTHCALLARGADGKERPVLITSGGGVGTFAMADLEKNKKDVTKPNPYSGENAFLPSDSEILVAEFGLKIMPKALKPHACNSKEYAKTFAAYLAAYTSRGGLESLALLYAKNIASAAWLWRNIDGAESATVSVEIIGSGAKVLSFKAFSLSDDDASLKELAVLMADALSGRRRLLRLRIRAEAVIGSGSQVYPSQSIPADLSGKGDESSKEKKLVPMPYTKNEAAITPQKIGNALRRVDSWYENGVSAIAVSPWGVDIRAGEAHRTSEERSLYGKRGKGGLKGLDVQLESLLKADVPGPQDHFIIANLILGGVFGEAAKDD